MNMAMLFQGQGSYKTEYIKRLMQRKEKLIDIWKTAEHILGWSILDLLKHTENVGSLPTCQAQPLIFMMEYSVWCAFRDELSDMPKYFAGHSLGEIVALTAAEACSFEEGLKLVSIRGKSMDQTNKTQQGMLALQGDLAQQANEICKKVEMDIGKKIYCANYNSSNQIVVSGDIEAIDYLYEHFEGIKYRLPVTKAFHTPFMKDAAEIFKIYLKTISFSKPKIPVMSNVTACPYQAAWTINDLLYRQIFYPVYWSDIMTYFKDKGIMVFCQATDSSLFRNMDIENSQYMQWGSLEDFSQNKIVDFDKTYKKTLYEYNGAEELMGAILKCMLSRPWNDVKEEDIIRAEMAYRRVENIPKENITKSQIESCINDLCIVLTAKGMDAKAAEAEGKRLLYKYGIYD